MKALVFDKTLGLRELPKPAPLPGEALVRVRLAGICATDLEIVKGYMGFKGVLGHEFTGVVEECEDKDLVGRRVTGEINLGCGSCRWCASGVRNHCPDRRVLGILGKDGVFAEYVTLPVENLHPVPDSVPDKEAVFVEPLAAAFRVTEQVDLGPGARACVLGDGRLGLLTAQAIALTGAEVVVSGRHTEKLSIVAERGIKTVVGTESIEPGFDVVVDATGSPGGLDSALGLVRPTGTVVLKTTVSTPHKADMNRLVIDEITLVGSRCGPFGPAIKALSDEGAVEVGALIERTFPLDQGVEAFEYAGRKGVMKVLLQT